MFLKILSEIMFCLSSGQILSALACYKNLNSWAQVSVICQKKMFEGFRIKQYDKK